MTLKIHTINSLAEATGESVWTVRNWLTNCGLPHRRDGRKYKIPESEFIEWQKRRLQQNDRGQKIDVEVSDKHSNITKKLRRID